ncbi:MiaB/RimO family radical SAM methylthiotransferase [bacterium]|nr:MiaB/RimO family radical SAM methylthiotransferase [bacterium]
MANKTFYLYTLGCKVNWCDSERIAHDASVAGWTRVAVPRDATVCLVNSCTVTAHADATCRKTARAVWRANPGAAVIVTGCSAAVEEDALRSMPEIADAVPGSDSARIIAAMEQAARNAIGSAAGTAPAASPGKFTRATARTRVFVKIQDGCDQFCAYCRVPLARGMPRSIPMDDVIAKVRELDAAGVREVVITGIHLAGYRHAGHTLADVVSAVMDRTAIPRIRIISLDARGVTDGLLALFTHAGRLMPHLHIPLQSGSDAVLGRMNRRVSTGVFGDAARRFLDAVAGATVSTDVIAGFPGETEDDAAQTLKVLSEMPFAKVHVFPFSPRPGTAAAKMARQFVPAAEIARREHALIEAGRAAAARCRALFAGAALSVLFESRHGGAWEGFSQNWLRVRSTQPGIAHNDIRDVSIDGICNRFAPVE